jgi:probable HAF family extracellular repeat protein
VSGMQDLGDLPGGGDSSSAFGINNAGQVVGTGNATTGDRAFIWDAARGMQDIGGMPGSIDLAGWGINNAGQVTGQVYRDEFYWVAFRWDAADGMQEFGPQPRTGYNYGSGINDAGQVVGDNFDEDLSLYEAFLWDEKSGMQYLGYLPGGGGSLGRDINNAGQVVGAGYTATGSRAFLWDATNGMQDLNNLIDPGLSAVLNFALKINALGQIVGNGTIGGVTQAFLLTPNSVAALPVPASLPLMLGGIGVLAGVARRRSKRVTHAAI